MYRAVIGALVVGVAEATTCTGEETVVPLAGEEIVTPANAAMFKIVSVSKSKGNRVIEPGPKNFNAHLGGFIGELRVNTKQSTLD